jgi:hypothetical protein
MHNPMIKIFILVFPSFRLKFILMSEPQSMFQKK